MSTRLLRPAASVTLADGEDTVTLTASEGRVGLDSTRIPYASAEVTIPLVSTALVETVDPREGQRVTIVGADDAAGTSRTFDLGLRSRSVDHKARTITLTVASDEALLQDYAPMADDTGAAGLTTVRAVVGYVLGKIDAELEPGTADGTVSTEAADELLTWTAGDRAWEFLEPITSAAGLRLFCDEARVWRLIDPAEYNQPGRLTLGPWNATEGVDGITRDDADVYCTGVVVRYKWEDADGLARTAVDTAGDPGLVFRVELERPYPGPGAAAAILARRAGRGRTQDVTALADWTAVPAQEVGISLPGTDSQVGQVSAVEWGLTNGLMTIAARGLADAGPGTWLGWDPAQDWQDADIEWEDA